MTVFQAILLGVIQGFTEFLPVSSSGHLVVFQYLLGLTESQLTFDVTVHFASLLTIIIFFRKQLLALRWSSMFPLLIGTIPAGLIGVLFKDQIEASFDSLIFAGITLIMTGGINFWIDRHLRRQTKNQDEAAQKRQEQTTTSAIENISWFKAILIGICQAVAIIPGISRSGSTVMGGMWQGLDRETAFTFSFLLAIPAIGGATLLQTLDVMETGVDPNLILPLVVGAIASFATGYLSLGIFKKVMREAHFEIFGWYCVLIGSAATIAALI